MSTTTDRSAYGLALLLFFAATALYMALPTQWHGGDAVQAAMAIEQDVTGVGYYHPSAERLYEPGELPPANKMLELNIRYFLDYPTVTLIGKVWHGLGWQGWVITPIILLRNVVGGLAAAFVFLAMFELTNDRRIALIVAVGLALTSAYWTFSSDIYQSINMVMLVCAAFYVLARLSKSGLTIGGLALLAALLAAATLYNIMAVLAMPGFGLAVLLLAPGAWVERFKKLLFFGVVYGAVGVAGLLLGALALGGGFGQANPFEWRSASSDTTVEVGGFEPAQDLVRAVLGFGKSQIIFPGISVRDYQSLRRYWDSSDTMTKVQLAGFYVVVLAVMLTPAAVLARRWRELPRGQRWLHVMLPSWLLIYALFNWYWLPSDVHYWMIPLLALWVTVGLLLSHLKDQLPRWYRPASIGIVAFIALAFLLNLTSQFLPESQNPNPWIAIAGELSDAEPNALFISKGHPLDFFIAYISGRNIVSRDIVFERLGDNLERTRDVVNEQIRRHRADGGEVYLYSETDEELSSVAEFIGLTREQLEPAYTFPELTIYRAMFPDEA